MVRNIAFVAVVGCLVSSSVGAEPLGERQGSLIFSADRLSPLFSYVRIKQTDPNGDSTSNSTTSLSFLWTGEVQDFYDIPRGSIDYVVAPHVTVGGTLFFTIPFSSSRSDTQGGTTTSRDGNKTNAFGIGARAGYVMPVSPNLSFWPRGGLSWTHVGITNPRGAMGNTDSQSVSQLGLNLEPMLVYQPIPHLGFVIGPTIDIPLSGNTHDETTQGGMTVAQDIDTSQLHIGISLGMLGYL